MKNHPDKHYYGGAYWKMPYPVCNRYLVTSMAAGLFVLVSDPLSPGSCLRRNDNADMSYTLQDLKTLFRDAEFLGYFNEAIEDYL